MKSMKYVTILVLALTCLCLAPPTAEAGGLLFGGRLGGGFGGLFNRQPQQQINIFNGGGGIGAAFVQPQRFVRQPIVIQRQQFFAPQPIYVQPQAIIVPQFQQFQSYGVQQFGVQQFNGSGCGALLIR